LPRNGGSIFVGMMFLGLGIGMIFGRADVGVLIGMGIGFIASELYKSRVRQPSEEVSERERGISISAMSSMLIGILFIVFGIMLIIAHETFWTSLASFLASYGAYIGALIIILMGIGFLYHGYRGRHNS